MKKTLFKIMSLALTIGIIASLLVAAVPAGALSIISVAPSSGTISATNVTYTITFTGSINLAAGATVNLTFPAGTDLNVLNTTLAGSDVTFNDGVASGDVNAVPSIVIVPAAGLITLTTPVAATIGNAWVIKVKKLVNPGTAGSYTVAVSTSAEPTPVISAAYNISAPGIIQLYNGAGAYLGTYADFTPGGIGAVAIADNSTIKVSPGVYVTPPGFTVNANRVTLTSAGGPAPVIYVGALTINGNFFKLTNMIVNPFIGSSAVFNGTDAVVTGCTFGKTSTPAYPYSVADVLVVANGARFTMTGSTVNTTSPAGFADIGVVVNNNDATFTNDTFKADQTVAFAPDSSVLTGAAVTGLDIIGCTFTGNGGVGFDDASGAVGAFLMNNTFTKYETAIRVTGMAILSGNTVTGCITNIPGFWVGAIQVFGGVVMVAGGKVADNTGYSFDFSFGGAGQVAGVNFSNNAKGFLNTTGTPVNAQLNYWGAANGPLDVIGNPTGSGDPVSVDVVYRPFLSSLSQASATGIATGGADTFDASMFPAGVSLSNYTGAAGAVVIMQKLASNPRTIDPGLEAIQYFDVYTQVGSATPMVLKLYAFGLTADCQAYYWSAVSNTWKLCSSQGIAGTGDFIYININPAGAIVPTTPNSLELVGTPFVIVKGFAPEPAAFTISAPLQGSQTGLTDVGFTWASVAGANAYEIVISAKADLSAPVVTQKTAGPAFTYTGNLTAGTYYWRVTALQNDNPVGLSAVGTFKATAPPVVVTTPQITITTQPAPTITFTQPAPTTLTITQPAAPAPITPAWIWGIIGIGAVLVIVVIVLIVRTRRTS